MFEDENYIEEISNENLLEGSSIWIMMDDETSDAYQIIVSSLDGERSISVAASSVGGIERAREEAASFRIPEFAYEYIGVAPENEEKPADPSQEKPSIQERLVSRYGADAKVLISASGWANYRHDQNDGAPWRGEFEIECGKWEEESCVLEELAETEIERAWGILDMSHSAWIEIVVARIGEDTFIEHFDRASEPRANELLEVACLILEDNLSE